MKASVKSWNHASRKETHWNTWILICAAAIVITIIVLIEIHLRQLAIDSTFLR